MNNQESSNNKTENFQTGCIICGKPITYTEKPSTHECVKCHKKFISSAVCEDGHFICDSCHSNSEPEYMHLLKSTKEKSPIRLLHQAMELPEIHMHGPEHHILVPCVLIAAFKNNGGDIDLEEALKEAVRRGGQIPGGTCGYWGVCGSAAGAGIYASIATKSNPLNAERWHLPQLLVSRCLAKISEVGGPRCCKRTAHIAVETAIAFTEEFLSVSMPYEPLPCTFSHKNKECLNQRCQFY